MLRSGYRSTIRRRRPPHRKRPRSRRRCIAGARSSRRRNASRCACELFEARQARSDFASVAGPNCYEAATPTYGAWHRTCPLRPDTCSCRAELNRPVPGTVVEVALVRHSTLRDWRLEQRRGKGLDRDACELFDARQAGGDLGEPVVPQRLHAGARALRARSPRATPSRLRASRDPPSSRGAGRCRFGPCSRSGCSAGSRCLR